MKQAVIGCLGFTLLISWAQAAPIPVIHNKADLKAELTGRDYKKMSEDEMYVDVLTRYQSNQVSELNRLGRLFLSRFPASVHADNVLYLMGYSALEKKRFSEALRYFDTLVKKYPTSNKAVSAEFAKGTAYKHMKLKSMAQSTFLKLRKKYPGSPEFYRAESELKILMMK